MPSHVHMVSHTGCKGMVVSSQYESEGRSLIDQVSGMDLFLCRDGDYEAWLSAQSSVDPEISVAESDWFIIRHTGGTTGKPKGWRIATALGSMQVVTGFITFRPWTQTMFATCRAHFSW